MKSVSFPFPSFVIVFPHYEAPVQNLKRVFKHKKKELVSVWNGGKNTPREENLASACLEVLLVP